MLYGAGVGWRGGIREWGTPRRGVPAHLTKDSRMRRNHPARGGTAEWGFGG